MTPGSRCPCCRLSRPTTALPRSRHGWRSSGHSALAPCEHGRRCQRSCVGPLTMPSLPLGRGARSRGCSAVPNGRASVCRHDPAEVLVILGWPRQLLVVDHLRVYFRARTSPTGGHRRTHISARRRYRDRLPQTARGQAVRGRVEEGSCSSLVGPYQSCCKSSSCLCIVRSA
jgi:hypothetical protein